MKSDFITSLLSFAAHPARWISSESKAGFVTMAWEMFRSGEKVTGAFRPAVEVIFYSEVQLQRELQNARVARGGDTSEIGRAQIRARRIEVSVIDDIEALAARFQPELLGN